MSDAETIAHQGAVLDFLSKSGVGASQAPRDAYGSSIQTLTNPEDELYKLELTLRNMKLDGKGEPIATGPPLLNDEGVSSIMGLVQNVVSRNTVLSNMDDKWIAAIVFEHLNDTLCLDLMVNKVNYGITNDTARTRIVFSAITTANICIRRALGQGERQFWKGSTQDIRTTVVSDAQKKGFMAGMAGMLGMGGK